MFSNIPFILWALQSENSMYRRKKSLGKTLNHFRLSRYDILLKHYKTNREPGLHKSSKGNILYIYLPSIQRNYPFDMYTVSYIYKPQYMDHIIIISLSMLYMQFTLHETHDVQLEFTKYGSRILLFIKRSLR